MIDKYTDAHICIQHSSTMLILNDNLLRIMRMIESRQYEGNLPRFQEPLQPLEAVRADSRGF